MSAALRRLLANLVLVLGSIAVVAISLEATFRFARISVGTVQINRGTVRRSINPRLAFELQPGALVRAEVDYRISQAGLRNPEVPVAKALGVRRIAVLGDSIAFGYWVAEEHAFPRQLERMLGARVQVLNFGVPGYNLDQDIEALRTKVFEYSPDLVVVALCLNDLEGIFSYEYGLTVDRSTGSATLGGRVLEGLLQRSVLAAWIEYRLAERDARRRFAQARNPLAGPLYEEAVGEQKRALLARFGTLHALLAARGIPGLVAVFPTFGNGFSNYPYRDLHTAVVESARESGLLAVDLLDCYSGYDLWDVRVDVVHPNPMGHRIAAHAIRDALCARGLLCDGAPAAAPCTGYRKQDFPSVRGY
jgi:lysophospholipase L1-like esterase